MNEQEAKEVKRIGTAFCHIKGWNYYCPHCNKQVFMEESRFKRHKYCPVCSNPVIFSEKVLKRAYRQEAEYREWERQELD